MSDTLSDVLIEALNDEYKARATYRHVINNFGEISPFINIVDAESRHINALLSLFDKYGIEVPDDDWTSRIEIPQSIHEACQLGVDAEIENGMMYERLLRLTKDYPDVHSVLIQLQRHPQRTIFLPFSGVSTEENAEVRDGEVAAPAANNVDK